ncbi:MAG: 6-pyruvoyl tetrahydropterin synthase family protein [Terriglobia bacterium]
MVLDLKELKDILGREVMEVFDHKFINHQVPALAGQIPTSENIARAIWRLLEGKIACGRLHHIRLYETPDLFVDYYGGDSVR